MMQKSSLSNFCLTNVRNFKVFLEVNGRDVYFAKSEQSYHLTSTDADAAAVRLLTDADSAAVRLLLPLHRKRYIPESYSIVCMWNGIKPIFKQVFDPMTLTCCFCFWRMLRIQVWQSQVVWRWHWPHIQRKLSLLMAKEEDHTKCL